MLIHGRETIESLLESEGYLFKLLANETGLVFFPHTTEHRDAGQVGIQYADDSQGNALAAMVKPGRIEFRHHRAFSDQRVREIARRMLSLPELEFARNFTVTYQGRVVVEGGG